MSDSNAAARYFVYDFEGGYNEFKTDAEREQGHQAAIDAHLDTGCDGWSEEVTNVVSGIVTHKTVKTDVQKKPAPCAAHPDHEYGDNDCEACITWDEYPNHEFDEVCKYKPAALLSASKPAAESDEQADLAFSVYSGLNALRWLLNITTEFDRKDVRSRQAARLLDEYTNSFGRTNRKQLEDMWKTLNDKLPNDGRINEYLRAHDAAGRALKAKGSEQ